MLVAWRVHLEPCRRHNFALVCMHYLFFFILKFAINHSYKQQRSRRKLLVTCWSKRAQNMGRGMQRNSTLTTILTCAIRSLWNRPKKRDYDFYIHDCAVWTCLYLHMYTALTSYFSSAQSIQWVLLGYSGARCLKRFLSANYRQRKRTFQCEFFL